MILLVNPRATRPKNRRFPLSLLSLGAVLPSSVQWEIIDGNRPGVDEFADISAWVHAREHSADPVRAIAMTVMPGPQLVSAVPLTRRVRAAFPHIPIVWGGYFPSLYPEPVLRASYVDYLVRGQGEHTLLELLAVLAGERARESVAGLGFRAGETIVLNAERPWVGPQELPSLPFHRIPVDEYLHPTFLGSRSGVYQASIGCPYGCRFCGVISVFGRREKLQAPARVAEDLAFLAQRHGMNGVHFYDNNFIVREDHAIELAERIAPLGLSWWCEARIDAMLRLSDATWRLLRRAGLRMVFFGAESGSDEVLRRMDKNLTTAQTLAVAQRAREHGIIPEFSFVLGDPQDAAGELENTLQFIRRLKQVNPAMELITYYYTPTPQRRGTYGDVDARAGTPDTLEEWTLPEWVGWMTHENPRLPWLTPELRTRLDDFTLVLGSRFPSRHDYRTRRWGRVLGQLLAVSRWRAGRYDNPRLLRAVRRLARGEPDPQAYGHLREGGG